MHFISQCLAASTLFLALLLPGCDNTSSSSGSPTGASITSAPILAPFQGRWKIDEPKTIALWKSEGMKDKDIALTQSMLQKINMPLHPDLNINGNTAVMPGQGMLAAREGEYLFYALHTEGPPATPMVSQIICGKAWHHEDRHDPGDMSKCYARLQIKDGSLYFSTRHAQDSADPDDPEITTMPLTAGSAATCSADKATADEWSPWTTHVFSSVK